jgi:hypothetical protein
MNRSEPKADGLNGFEVGARPFLLYKEAQHLRFGGV